MTIAATDDLLQQAEAASARAKQDASRAYVELLSRADAPRKGDAAKLAELMALLGITLEEVRRDREALAKHKGLAAAAGKHTAKSLSEAHGAAVTAWSKHSEAARKRAAEDSRENARLEAAVSTASFERDVWDRNCLDLKRLRDENPRLFPAAE